MAKKKASQEPEIVQLNVEIPADLKEEVKQLAISKGLKLHKFIEFTLEKEVEHGRNKETSS